ncbi:uncharacterized protein LOC107043216 [Diachasma alloeum]|nr:uncharacterized protein LOC107043216 [Diachasma alloeum]
MTSRFWNTWRKEESELESPIYHNNDEDENWSKNAHNNGEIRERDSSPAKPIHKNGKSHGNTIKVDHRFEPWTSNGSGSMTDDNDRVIGARLMNGKSSASNGSGKQVKCTDDLSELHDCNDFVRKHESFEDDERKSSGIKRLTNNIENLEYKGGCIERDVLNRRHSKQENPFMLKDERTNGDFINPRRPSGRENESMFVNLVGKGHKEDIYSQRSSRYTEDSPDREVENTLKDTNSKRIMNGSRTRLSGENYDVQFIKKYGRTVAKGPQIDVDLVRKSRKNSLEDKSSSSFSRKSSFEYHYRSGDADDKHIESSRSSPIKRDAFYDRDNSADNSSSRVGGGDHHSRNESCERDSEYVRSKCDVKKNDRHSRPLTPPTTLAADHEVSHNYTIKNSRVLSSKPDPYDDFIRNKNRNKAHRNSCDLSWIDRELSRYSDDDESPERECSNRFSGNNRRENRNGDFSTIERNGTTVIRIRGASTSPVVMRDEMKFDSRSSRDESEKIPRRFVDDDEDSEDYEDFFNNRKRESAGSPQVTQCRHLDSTVQITDLEDGQPCLQCGETCPGFSPHNWRKNCTSCKCPKEAHDVCHEEWVSVRARLGLKGDAGTNNYVGFEPRERGLAWAPPGLPPNKVEEYFSMLPEISVPRLGTPGERHRDRQLSTQLPKQDLARAYCRHLDPQHSASADDFMAARNEIALDIGTVQEVFERNHECGTCHEPLKYGSLVIMASKLGQLYHPTCFKCTHCDELLVDLAYCVHDNALYCERHYAEELKPRCAACDELIFSGEYTKAMNKDWHSGHFCCWQCDESLTGQRYVLRDEHPYCIKCYESIFANGCEECNKIIGIDSKDLSYKDKHWHEACFLCHKCRVSLVDKQFGSKVDKIYCGNCYDAQFASRCDGCGEIFRAGTKKMEYKTRQWHEKCFCCVVCKNPIGLKSFIPREQEIYCAGCYEDKFATRCVKCNKIITSGGVTYKNEPWHRDCFTCTHCNNSLAGQRFTSRDDKPYCAECFGELFAKRCTSCAKPITGIGGTRFISFEDRHWHNDCFICAGCKTSLVGRGFITDAEDIICPECAKAKLTTE